MRLILTICAAFLAGCATETPQSATLGGSGQKVTPAPGVWGVGAMFTYRSVGFDNRQYASSTKIVREQPEGYEAVAVRAFEAEDSETEIILFNRAGEHIERIMADGRTMVSSPHNCAFTLGDCIHTRRIDGGAPVRVTTVSTLERSTMTSVIRRDDASGETTVVYTLDERNVPVQFRATRSDGAQFSADLINYAPPE